MGFVRVSCRQIDVPSEKERPTLWWGCWVLNKGSNESVVFLSSSCPSAMGLEGSSCGSPGSRSAECMGISGFHLSRIRGSKCYGGYVFSFLFKSEPEGMDRCMQWAGRGPCEGRAGVVAWVSLSPTLGLSYPWEGHVEKGEAWCFFIFLFLFFLSKNL